MKAHARCTCVASRSVHLSTIRCKLVATFPPQSVYSPIRAAVIQWILSLPVVEPWLFFRPARSLITVMTGSNYRSNNLLIFVQKIRIYWVVGWLIDWCLYWFLGVTYKLQPMENSVPQTERFILHYIIIIIIIMSMKRILWQTLYLISPFE